MKLNKIKSCCLDTKRFNLVVGPEGVQWFTDNRSLWLCLGIRVKSHVLPELFGLTDKQIEKCLFLERTENGDAYAIGMSDGEEEIAYCGDVWEFDQRLLAFAVDGQMLFVPRAWADAVKVTDETRYTLRMIEDDDGKPTPMVAVYDGMICEAMLQPISASYAAYIINRAKAMGKTTAWTVKEASTDEVTDRAG